MQQVQITSKNITLFIAAQPFARGGEGLLYEVLSPKAYKGAVVKIYHQEKRTQQRAKKIDYLVANPPLFAQDEAYCPVAWPLAAIHDKGRFIGFLLRKFAGKTLEILCTPKLPKKLDQEWARFDFKQPEAMELRQKVCFNLAVALQHIHAAQHYAFVDLKPDNILIQPNGLVSLVDMDSIEVSEEGLLLFAAPVATPDYTPAEFYQKEGQKWGYRESWDRFSMSVIFYKVLLGIHPYAASCSGIYEKADTLAAKIEEGLFTQHPSKTQFLSVIPTLHKGFEKLPNVLKDCFMQCFAYGHEQPKLRPTAEEWCWALAGEINQEVRNDLSYLPFSSNLSMPDWPSIPIWLSANLDKSLVDYARNNGETLKLNFKLHGPSIKRYFWIGRQTKEDWIKLQDSLSPNLKDKLILQKWTLQEQALLAQWLLDWKTEQKEQLDFCKNKLTTCQAFYHKNADILKAFLRDLNRQLALQIQKTHQQKRESYILLTEDETWQQFRGNSLAAKIWHLTQWRHSAQNTIDDNNLKLRMEGERVLNKAMHQIEKSYYQNLQVVEDEIKTKRDLARKELEVAYENRVKNSPDYLKIVAEGAVLHQNYQLELKALQENYANQLAELDKQFQQNLLSIALISPSNADAQQRQSDLNRQKALFEQMQETQKTIIQQNYNAKKEALAETLKEALIIWNANLDLGLQAARKSLEIRAFKNPLQLIMDKLQQELQLAKAEIEKEYLDSRAICQEKFELLKKNIAHKIQKEKATVLEQHRTFESHLTTLHQNYQNAIEACNTQLNIAYTQLAESLAYKKNRLQTLIDLELEFIAELFFTSSHNLQSNWMDTVGGAESDWVISQLST